MTSKATPLNGDDYMRLVESQKQYARDPLRDESSNMLIRDLTQSYLTCRGDRSFTPDKARRQGQFEALLAEVSHRLNTSH
jgi:acetyl-CoA carboxylase alpha subunit